MSSTIATRFKTTMRATAVAAMLGGAALGLAGAAHAELYGDPDSAAEYWEAQSLDDCVLMSVADVVGQITGDKPSELEIVALAAITPSDAHPGSVYIPSVDDIAWLGDGMGTHMYDAVTMLERYDIEAVYTDAEVADTDDDFPPTGMNALANYVADGHKVIVAVNSAMIWGQKGGDTRWADHAVVVTGIDTTEGVVYLNDSGNPDGQAMPVPVDVFEAAWATGDDTMIVTVETA